jgi:hypothetical protein
LEVELFGLARVTRHVGGADHPVCDVDAMVSSMHPPQDRDPALPAVDIAGTL